MAQELLYPVVDGKKQCGSCREWLDLGEFTKYRDKYCSSRCKKCANKYGKEYRDKPENKEKRRAYQKKYMADSLNRENKNLYIRQYKKRASVRAKNYKSNRLWLKNEKQKAVDYKSGKCSVCGYNKCLSALEFHHTNPEEKDGYNSHWTFERNKSELDKCVLLCANCHREKHEEMDKYEQT